MKVDKIQVIPTNQLAKQEKTTGTDNNIVDINSRKSFHGPSMMAHSLANQARLHMTRDTYKGPDVFIDPQYLDEFTDEISREESKPANILDKIMMTELSKLVSTGGQNENETPKGIRDSLDLIILKNNFILIHGVVTDVMCNEVRLKTQLLASAMKKTGNIKPIHFLVNSPGGSVVAMNGILDSMDRLKNTKINGQNIVVATYCDGMAASAASVILTNGTKGYRYISPRSEVMIHQPLGGTSGQATDMEIHTKRILKMKQQLNDFFAKNTKMTLEELKLIMERDYYMDSKESLDKGFIDSVYDSFSVKELENTVIDSLIDKNTEAA